MKLDVEAVARILNRLKREHKLQDYAVFGAVASTFYIEPIYTEDIDVMVLAATDSDYVEVWRELSKFASKILDFGFIIEGTKVQILPTSIHPLYESALRNARTVRLRNVRVKVVDREHLILLHLKAFREKDIYKASFLLQSADMDYLGQLLRRFDNDGTLAARVEKVLHSSY